MAKFMDELNALNIKIDNLSEQMEKLSEAITRLVRIEEKYLGLEKDVNGFGARLTKIEDNQQKLITATALNSAESKRTWHWVERILSWAIIAGLTAKFVVENHQ